ncbi:MAG TPA: branched-chain amino acid ABC transporter permease [Rubrivivax sp.]|nr:branched-chain amino acid ABC transporter permease [Burkholderiales bacterium]HNT37540.1 branched-chain amino acid ABC transporter permease [Rubrivivax sp.]
MTAEASIVTLLNGLSYGLLLFMLSAGLTLVFGLMGVLNFAHASFYMLGAYLGCSVARGAGFWLALVVVPLLVALLGALFEQQVLRRTRRFGAAAELLVTFGLAIVVLEFVQLAWGRSVQDFPPPALLQGPAFTLVDAAGEGLWLKPGAAPQALCATASCTPFPATRAFMALVALLMLLLLWLLATRTRAGLVIQAALTHPQMVQALGHDVPRTFTWVFALGCGLAGLAGVVGGSTFVTEPAMAAALGPIVFVVVVVGGLGSLTGAFVASILIGLVQTLAVGIDASLADLTEAAGWAVAPQSPAWLLLRPKLSQVAPILPYLLLVAVLVVRPRGLLGRREG